MIIASFIIGYATGAIVTAVVCWLRLTERTEMAYRATQGFTTDDDFGV